MTTAVRTTSQESVLTGGTLKRLQTQLAELGLNLSVWDHLGRNVGEFKPACDFCQAVQGPRAGCLESARELAGRVVADAEDAKMSAWCGGCVVGVPIHRRRRLLGAAVACFPVREMLDEGSLARMCDRLHLDRQHMTRLAQAACRHCQQEARDFLSVLRWLLDRNQAAQTAQDELATLSINLATTYEELSLLYRISGEMRLTQQPREFLERTCNELLEVMNISAAAALVHAHPTVGDTGILVAAGKARLDESQIELLVRTQIVPRFAKSNRPIVDNNFLPTGGVNLSQAVRNFVAVPLAVEEKVIGVLVGLDKLGRDFDSVDLKLISSIGSQTSIFLANSRLYADLQDLLMGVLHALTATIDAKDPYTSGHSRRVALISKRLAEQHGFSREKAERIYLCGLLHDVGKIGVPEKTLRKQGRLAEEEFRSVKRHPDIGAKILAGIRQWEDVIVGILTHHERPDGKGYPQGLKGDEIPVEGSIIGLADSFDAMTSNRTYREALSLEEAIAEVRRNSGTQFSPELAETLLSLDLVGFLEELRHSSENVVSFNCSQEARR